jgi:proline dehydrogenase
MIRFARSGRLKRVMQGVAVATPLARRFVGGDSPETAVATARRLCANFGIASSLFYLGEYVSDLSLVEKNVEATIAAIELLGAKGLDVNVSVDPTAIGHLVGEDLCARNADRLACAVAAQPVDARKYLMLDMEDLSLLEPTLRLHEQLLARGLPASVTLQARLRRTEDDLRALLGKRTAVRLVKGAFPLGPEHDHQGRIAIAKSYLALAEAMLSAEAREGGLYPVFATHDDVLTNQVIAHARASGRRPDGTNSKCSTASAPTGSGNCAPGVSRYASTCPSAPTGGPTRSAASARTRGTYCCSVERSLAARPVATPRSPRALRTQRFIVVRRHRLTGPDGRGPHHPTCQGFE